MLMMPKRSDVFDRISKPTPNKRGAQVGMIKTIQLLSGSERPKGDWLHTAGPGKVAINYWIYEQAFHPDSIYTIVEYQPDLALRISNEAGKLRYRLASQPWSNKVTTTCNELFTYACTQIYDKKRNVLVVDADFCTTLSSLVSQKLIDGINTLCLLQKSKDKSFFLSLTFSNRNSSQTDKSALKLVEKHINKHHGTLVYSHRYKDGGPMQTKTWHFKQEAI